MLDSTYEGGRRGGQVSDVKHHYERAYPFLKLESLNRGKNIHVRMSRISRESEVEFDLEA